MMQFFVALCRQYQAVVEFTEGTLNATELKFPCIFIPKEEEDILIFDQAVVELKKKHDDLYLSMLEFSYIFQEDQADGVIRLGYQPEDLPFTLTVVSTGFGQFKGEVAKQPLLCLQNFYNYSKEIKYE